MKSFIVSLTATHRVVNTFIERTPSREHLVTGLIKTLVLTFYSPTATGELKDLLLNYCEEERADWLMVELTRALLADLSVVPSFCFGDFNANLHLNRIMNSDDYMFMYLWSDENAAPTQTVSSFAAQTKS